MAVDFLFWSVSINGCRDDIIGQHPSRCRDPARTETSESCTRSREDGSPGHQARFNGLTSARKPWNKQNALVGRRRVEELIGALMTGGCDQRRKG